ncbi:MAG: DUF932 domain-containing protein [Salegentibacter sp.]|uniref:DUF932 domain-containing protein n=1 Tax=Salegentibacter sp. TaxID=1903072 RepID=UPI00286FEABA|nr:DUF932 domain-containing protein [Salegentibacter sp.]MDR9457862.1 DUF932 domain-containing protein [Salegentibacter sp.]
MYLSNLQQDDLFVKSEVRSMESLTGLPSRKGLENAILSNGKLVNVVSSRYGHIPNELFFGKAKQKLEEAGLKFQMQSTNRQDRCFSLDFIIDNENQFTVKHPKDKILPMLRFTNSYDGTEKTSGHFGFFREICSNGLHIAQSNIQFSIRHTKKGVDLYMPKLNELFSKFMDNEYYTIQSKFNKLMEIKILDTKSFVKDILEETKLFRYECSDKNPEPSKKSREVLEILNNESIILGQDPNLWIGYNAFNAILHKTLKKGFSQQRKADKFLFDKVYQMV